MKRTSIKSVLILTLLGPLVAHGQDSHPAEDIREAAQQFLVERMGTADADIVMHATAGQLDPRLRLPRCQQPLTVALPPTARISARVTVGVSCPAPRWTIYVPVSVETELPVLVMRQAAARDSKPTPEDVEVRRMRVPGLADTYIRDVSELVDRHLKIAVAPGTPLDVNLLAADILVKRGQRVTLVVQAAGIEVRALGEAIADATAAGRVRVLNLATRRIVEGQVESRDRVRVSM